MTIAADALTCSTCLLPVIVAKDVDGKRMVLDANPTRDGRIAIEDTDVGPIAHIYTKNVLIEMTCDRYEKHFATCQAAQIQGRR